MKSIINVALAAVTLSLGACQQGSSDARAEARPEKVDPAPAPAAGSSDGLSSSTVVATWTQGDENKTLTYGELKEARSATFLKLERERYNTIRRELEGYVIDRLMTAEAEKAGKSQEAYIESLAAAVPEAEVKAFYESTVAKGGKGPPLDQVEDRIRQYLSMKNEVDRVKEAAGMKVTLPEPEVPVASFDLSDRPFKGPADAPVTIVEFSDFQCPYCARATEPVEALAKAFPEKVKIYFLHFPLSFHQQAMPAAKATRCAQKQGKFWEMHDKVFENQAKMGDEDLQGYAKELGLKMEDFKSCLEDPATEAFVKEDMAQGTKAGVAGTPSFYVNGKQHQGPPSVDEIRSLLDS